MRVSLMTPTADREAFLPAMYQALQRQTHQDWEWWVCDTSWRPSPFLTQVQDRRVHYFFETGVLSIGQKRNALAEASGGEILVHIDDDDYYAPEYLSEVVAQLQEYDFCALTSWFAYDVKVHQGFYWSTSEPAGLHYAVGPLIEDVTVHPLGGRVQIAGATGYGFTYGYRRAVWKSCPFLHLDHQEDHHFFRQLTEAGHTRSLRGDEQGLVVKMIHALNVSGIFPQYRIPFFLMSRYIPTFAKHVDEYYPFNRPQSL